VIINNHNSQLIFNKTIITYDEKKNKQEKIIKESFLDALLDSQNGFNKDNNYYSNIIYDRITKNFKEICNFISENKIDNLLTEIDNKISDSTMILKQNKISNNNFAEERNKYFNDWACFLMTHYNEKYIQKIIKTIVISKSNEDETVDIYIKKLLLKPCNTHEFKRYFEYFFDSSEKIHEYYVNIVRYIIHDIYNIYIEALILYDLEYNECKKLEKEGLSFSDIEKEINKFKNNNKNMFYDAFKHDKNYQNDPFIKDEINQQALFSNKIKCIYKNLIKKMSIQYFKIFGFFYKNNFLKEDIIKIIMKNNFKYTSIKFMKEFVKYSNIKWNDSCNYHKKMMILFKKKYEVILDTSSSIIKFGYEELFKIYNNIGLINNSLEIVKKTDSYFIPINSSSIKTLTKLNSNNNFVSICITNKLSSSEKLLEQECKDTYIQIKPKGYLLEHLKIDENLSSMITEKHILSKSSFNVCDNIDELRISTETPLFCKKTYFNSIEDDLLIDYNLLKLMNESKDDQILDYINTIITENDEKNMSIINNQVVIITFLHSLENNKIDELECIKKLVIKMSNIIKIDKDIIDNIFNKYSELKNELKIDNPQIMEKLNIIFS